MSEEAVRAYFRRVKPVARRKIGLRFRGKHVRQERSTFIRLSDRLSSKRPFIRFDEEHMLAPGPTSFFVIRAMGSITEMRSSPTSTGEIGCGL